MSSVSVEQELWNIYTYYTLTGNPLDPTHLKGTHFVKLCRDCQIFRTVSAAAVNVVFQQELQMKGRQATKAAPKGKRGGSGKQLMAYSDFLNCLMSLAPQVHPDADSDTVFQRLLMENILPLACRRVASDVSAHLEDPEIVEVLGHFDESLHQIFTHYASLSDHARNNNLTPRERQRQARQQRLVNAPPTMNFEEYSAFCNHFEITVSLITNIQVAEVYLSAIKIHPGGDNMRELSSNEWFEVLVRLALTAYEPAHFTTPADKVKGLLLYMYKAVTGERARRGAVESRGDLEVAGSARFIRRWEAYWRADQLRDYVSTEQLEAEGEAEAEDETNAVLGRFLQPPAPPASASAGGGMGSPGTSVAPPSPTSSVASSAIADAVAGASANLNELDIDPSKLTDLLQRRPEIAQMLYATLASEG